MRNTQELKSVFGVGIDKTDNYRKIENVDIVYIFSEIEQAKLYALSLCFKIHMPIIVFSFPVNLSSNDIDNNNVVKRLVCRYTNDIRKNNITDIGSIII